jgi:hypothetical protein
MRTNRVKSRAEILRELREEHAEGGENTTGQDFEKLQASFYTW